MGYNPHVWRYSKYYVYKLPIKYSQLSFTHCLVCSVLGSFCYISRFSLVEYLYIPSAILFFINTTFFLLTAWTIHRYQESTKMATKNMNKDRQS